MLIPFIQDGSYTPLLTRREVHIHIHDRTLTGGFVPQQNPNSNSRSSEDPRSTKVLIPLIISMILIVLGVGTAIWFYISYKRRHRIWLADFTLRREAERRRLEEEEKRGKEGPGWWEIEVGDGDDDGDDNEDEDRRGEGRWEGAYGDKNEKREDSHSRWNPVAVTYHHEPEPTPSAPTTPLKSAKPTPKLNPSPSSETDLHNYDILTRTPQSVEMTVLIAMPSPSPARSRRPSPASSVPSLNLGTEKDGMSETRIEDVWEDEIPDVQLATVLLPIRRDGA